MRTNGEALPLSSFGEVLLLRVLFRLRATDEGDGDALVDDESSRDELAGDVILVVASVYNSTAATINNCVL